MNIRAARIGPTVCELDGPMPMVNNSVTLMAAVVSIRMRGRANAVWDMRDHHADGAARQ
jgi:hypothetical protein